MVVEPPPHAKLGSSPSPRATAVAYVGAGGVAVGFEDGTLLHASVRVRASVASRRLHVHHGAVHSIKSVPCRVGGSRVMVLTASVDSAVLWDAPARLSPCGGVWEQRKVLEPSTGIVSASLLAAAPTRTGVAPGPLVAALTRSNSITLWDATCLRFVRRLELPEGEHTALVAFGASPDSTVLMAVGANGKLYSWDLTSGALPKVYQMPREAPMTTALAVPSPEQVVVLRQGGVFLGMHVTQTQGCRAMFEFAPHGSKVSAFDVDSRRHRVLACTPNGTLLTHDLPGEAWPRRPMGAPPAPPPARRQPTPPSPRSSPPPPWECQPRPSQLHALLRVKGELPERSRATAWKRLLRLPGNRCAFHKLVSCAPHPAAAALRRRYPLRDRYRLAKLAALLSGLARWCPMFAEAEFLPALVFPLVVVFGADDLGAFETAMTVLLRWGRQWLATFPQPPLPVLALVEAALRSHDRRLSRHLSRLGVGAAAYGWPLLRSVFTEVLSRKAWLRLFDHLCAGAAADRAGLLPIAAAVAFAVAARRALLTLESREDVGGFFRRQHAVDMGKMLAVMYEVWAAINPPGTAKGAAAVGVHEGEGADSEAGIRLRLGPQEVDLDPLRLGQTAALESLVANMLCAQVSPFPLPRGRYPVVGGFPECTLDYQIRERERIVHDEKCRLVEELEQRAQHLDHSDQLELQLEPLQLHPIGS